MRHRRILRVAGLIAGAALIVGWFVLLRPVALGGPASYVVVSGVSMEPGLHPGDLVIVHQATDYRPGDVVAYRIPLGQPSAGSLVIHRIVAGDARVGFVVQGDANDTADPWRPTPSKILGKSWIELPGSGAVLQVLRRPLVLAILLGGLAAYSVMTLDLRPRLRRFRPGRTMNASSGSSVAAAASAAGPGRR